MSKEDEEREQREDKEREEKRRKEKSHKDFRQEKHKDFRQEKQHNYHNRESRSDVSNWRSENHSYLNSYRPPQNHYHQNAPRWDRNSGGYYDSGRSNRNRDQYGSGSVNWHNQDGQYYDDVVVDDYNLDPNISYGYHRSSQPQQGYSGDHHYNNNSDPVSPYLGNFNQQWGSGANQQMPFDYGAQGYRDNNLEYNSYDRSYSRQNSNSWRQGGAKKSDRMKPF